MRVILFSATGMVGGGVLLECRSDPRVSSMISIGRRTRSYISNRLRLRAT